MNKSAHESAFAVWITGLPASGKSTITARLIPQLEERGLRMEVLESDAVRRVLTPEATYSRIERDLFYRALAWMGSRLVAHGISVVIDATATRRAYRDFARETISRFVEVAIECPLEVCKQRDRKGTYRRGLTGASKTVPGLQDPYEAPIAPDLRIDSTEISPEKGADLIIAVLQKKGFLSTEEAGGLGGRPSTNRPE